MGFRPADFGPGQSMSTCHPFREDTTIMRFPVLAIVAVASFAMLGSATLATAQVVKSKDSPESVNSLIGKITGPDRNASFQAVYELRRAVARGRDGRHATRRSTLLSRKAEFVAEPDVAKLLDEPRRARQTGPRRGIAASNYHLEADRADCKSGHVVVGRLVVEDGKQDPEMVLAQMPILKEGYFAGEVGDLERPIAFRSQGYQNLDVPLKGKTGDLVYLGDVTLKALPESRRSSLRGKIVLDAPKDSESPVRQPEFIVGEPNTPHNGYSPRRGWPKPLELPVSKRESFPRRDFPRRGTTSQSVPRATSTPRR